VTDSPAVAATSSLQFRPMSNFGTLSATATTKCELTMIIDEMGIMTAQDSGVDPLVQFLFKTHIFRLCENGQASPGGVVAADFA